MGQTVSPLAANAGIIQNDRFAESTATDAFEFFYRFDPSIFFFTTRSDGSSIYVSYYDSKRVGDYYDETNPPPDPPSEAIRTRSDIERGDHPIQLKELLHKEINSNSLSNPLLEQN